MAYKEPFTEIVFWGPMNSKVGTLKSQKNTANAARLLGYKTSFVSCFGEYSGDEFDNYYLPGRYFKLILDKTKDFIGFRLTNFILQVWFCFFLFKSYTKIKQNRILIHGSLSNLIPAFFLNLIGVKMIISIQGLPNFLLIKEKRLGKFNWRYVEGYFRRILWRKIYRNHVCYTISSSSANEMRKIGINCSFIPNIVKNNEIQILHKLDSERIALVGRISKQKNLPYLDHIIKNLPGVTFDIYGDPDSAFGARYLDRWITRHNVEYYGFQDRVFENVKAKFLLQLSLWEDAALVPIEAKYSGLTVIYSNYCDGIDDLIPGSEYMIDVRKSKEEVLLDISRKIKSGRNQPFEDIYRIEHHSIKLQELVYQCQRY